jgi:predicted hotdog family 3-hydroxylacyl-ACP dehydratase
MSVAQQHARLPAVEELIQQRGEMLLLDRLVERGPEHVIVAARVLPREHPLMDPQRGMPTWVGIELMAQTVAVFAGLDHLDRGLPPRIGLLLGTRSFVAEVLFVPQGTSLFVRADLSWRDDGGLGVFACELTDSAGTVIARALVKGYVPENIQDHLGETFDA